jgi:hypothetical protein
MHRWYAAGWHSFLPPARESAVIQASNGNPQRLDPSMLRGPDDFSIAIKNEPVLRCSPQSVTLRHVRKRTRTPKG